MNIPLFARKAILDFAETALATVFALAFAFPSSTADLKAIGVAVGVGLIGAGISAARRAIPGFLAWLGAALSVPPEDGGDQT